MKQQKQLENAHEHLRSGNAKMAAEICELNLKKFPGNANFLCLSAMANLAMKNFAIAEARIGEAVRLYPDYALAHETLGDLRMVQGRGKDAVRAYGQAVRLDPTRSVTHDKIERARRLESIPPATAANAIRQAAVPFAAEINRALEHEQSGDPQSAEMIYRDILKRDPNHVEAARLLAAIATANKRFRDAEVFLQRVVELAPDYLRAWVDLTNVQRELGQFADGIVSAKEVLRIAPDSAESHMVYAAAIGMAGDHEGAISAYQRALEIAPKRAAVFCGMAHHQKTIGQQEESIASYRQAIASKPDHAEAYWSLANLKTFRFEDEEVKAMENLLETAELSGESRSQIHNALGLEYEGRKDYRKAFANFEHCNLVRRKLENYDPVETESTHDRLIELFDAEFIARNAGVGNAPVTPILVVGLPRSGSTLIEQVLASHSRVDGTHELGELARAVQSVRRRTRRHARFPESLADFGIDEWRRLGEDYLHRTELFRGSAPYFVDKNPNNFIYAGALKLALPNCKIINAKRHPLDSCFGSFKQLFASGQPFTYDMTELGEYYLQYDRLMDHWHKVLPGFVLDVQYERVVADLESEVRRILDYCGLGFEEQCLRFHETERAVKTASSEQVRRPIYSSSVNLWRNYEPYLDELVHILEPILRTLPLPDQPSSMADGRST